MGFGLCSICYVRVGQWPRGLCRRCDRALGTYVAAPAAGRRYVTAATEAAERAREERARREAPDVPRPVGERVVRGRVYEVVWDGRAR